MNSVRHDARLVACCIEDGPEALQARAFSVAVFLRATAGISRTHGCSSNERPFG
jgi:hypothetical protein